MHLQVVREEEQPSLPDVSSFKYTAPADTPGGAPANVPNIVAQATTQPQPQPDLSLEGGPALPQQPDPNATMAPIVKSDAEKIGRNDPCHCGSGKKYKHCHGR